MNALALYLLAVALGDVAFWQTGLLRKMFSPRDYLDWPDPADAPWMLAYLLTPLPGLVSLCNLFIVVVYRMRGLPRWRWRL